MELLDLLESRVDSLVTEIELLRKENAKLREDTSANLTVLAEIELLRKENAKLREDTSANLTVLTEENYYLKQALEEEQQLKHAVLKRVDGLLSRLQGTASGTS